VAAAKTAGGGGVFMLGYFTVLQLLMYADRTLMSGLLPFAATEFGMSSVQSGMLGTGFMGGFMLMSPISAVLGRKEAWSMRVIGLGLAFWVVSVVTCGLAKDYKMLLASRILAGCGEAGFCSLAPPMIDDAAPSHRRSIFLSIYFSGIFVGGGAGFVVSGLFTSWQSGRYVFIVEGLCMLPLCAVVLFCEGWLRRRPQDPELLFYEDMDTSVCGSTPGVNKGTDVEEDASTSIRNILQSRIYVLVVLGYSATIFTVGGLSFWGPSYLSDVVGMKQEAANLGLGVVTMITGILGTTAGGIMLDRSTNSDGSNRKLQAIKISLILLIFASPFSMIAVAARSPTMFFVFIGLAEFCIFASTTPANVAMMEEVDPRYRGLALGLCVLASHLFGDLIPPVLVGYITSVTGSLVAGVWLLALWLNWSIVLWGISFQAAQKQPAVQECLLADSAAH
jgi:MFS family permease